MKYTLKEKKMNINYKQKLVILMQKKNEKFQKDIEA